MPFDSGGNFTRNYNFTADKNAGIKIQSARIDGEYDNYATAMNQTFLRDGRTGMAGNLNLATNTIYGVGAGILSAPGIRFSTDVTTGIYLPAAGQVSFVAGGVERIRASSTGAAITGALTISSDGTVSGNLGVTGTSTFGGISTHNADVLIPSNNLGINQTPVATSGSRIHLGSDISLSNATASHIHFNGYNNAGYKIYNAGFAAAMRYDPTIGALQVYTGSASGIANAASGIAERARFDASGNFGINATSLAAKLHVAGTVTIGTQANVAAVVGQGGTSDLYLGSIGGSVPFIGSQGANPLAFYTNGGERARFDATGNFGIGATSPVATTNYGGITVNGTTGAIASFGVASTEKGRIQMDTTFGINSITALPLTFLTTNAERMRIDASGNVGMMTNNPQAPLHVFGASARVDSSASQPRFELWNGVTNYGGIGTTGWVLSTTATDLALNSKVGGIVFYTNGSTTEKARIDTNGNFGVGTASPVNTANYGGITVNGTTGGNISGMVAGTEKSRISTDSAFTLNATAAINMVLKTNNTTQFTITSSGEVYMSTAQSPTQTYDVGYLGLPQVGGAAKTVSYTCVLADAGQHVLMNNAALTVTIPANASVAYPIGTALMFVNSNAANLTIAITTDTLTMANSTLTGNRTLAQNGMATAIKVAATSWLISGAGLS